MRQIGVGRLEFFQRLADAFERFRLHDLLGIERVERGDHQIAATFLGVARTNAIDHQAAHGAGRVGQETTGLVEVECRAAADVEPGFVHQRAGAQHVVGAVAPHFAARQPAQIAVQRGEERFGLLAGLTGLQTIGLGGVTYRHGTDSSYGDAIVPANLGSRWQGSASL